ncbi:MAG: mandelate racemase/muconate lactonizing enzyme family protein [Alphaproteobacteria bacterium]|nr:mandelate racemase/muconate lactonizing enzyme family protein [Alphaproteobacteria bacterium]MBU1551580.1 mandelate racemase/muconate lactonizing enzyme family protein [Alphaproteobacteria bacterium]MBU2337315.1 mandelate racemase/muconate lactonizing enzyme family protein [Alphaproteobacteria bacterium]MBU2388058.1 mandelate racemase/muconate lactonizing enzyme family protein [Alphaproteobacteria bacterium]
MDTAYAETPGAVRITDVIAHPLSQTLPTPTITSWGVYSEVSIILIEVRTDAGIVGVGEVLARFSPRAYVELIETSLKPRLIGQDARNIAALWQSMRRALSGRAGGMLIEAIAGIDIALWDILGKAAGLPIAKLLGGIGRERIDVYAAAVNWVEDEDADRELERYLGEGFPRIKVKMSNPVKEACRRIERLRKRAGDDVGLCVDANWAYTLDQAVEVGKALSANGYFWFEEPLAPENEQGYEELRKRCDVPLAAGESNFTADQARRLVAGRTLSILQPDVARAGGITETRRMADYAALHDVAYAPHIGMSGIICETASVHLSAALPNFQVMECECDLSPFKRDLADLAPGCIRQANGTLDVPTGPGLGIEINWDAVSRLRTQ